MFELSLRAEAFTSVRGGTAAADEDEATFVCWDGCPRLRGTVSLAFLVSSPEFAGVRVFAFLLADGVSSSSAYQITS